MNFICHSICKVLQSTQPTLQLLDDVALFSQIEVLMLQHLQTAAGKMAPYVIGLVGYNDARQKLSSNIAPGHSTAGAEDPDNQRVDDLTSLIHKGNTQGDRGQSAALTCLDSA